MNESSPYLDIYKNDGNIVFQLGKDIFLDKNSEEFFEYLGYLKNNKINIILLDEKGEQIFNSDGNNYFLDNEKRNILNQINNILILDNKLEILDKYKNKVEFISKEILKEILEGKHNFIAVKKYSNLYERLLDIYNLLNDGISKATLVQASGIKDEIEGLGAGTMFVDLGKAEFKILENREIFNQFYKEKVLAGEWKSKGEEKLEKIFSNYKVLEVDGTILGGYYLGDFEIVINGENKKGKLLENLFASKTGGGIGKILGEEIKKETPIFAYSKREKYFTDLGFTKVEGQKSETGADLWMYKKS